MYVQIKYNSNIIKQNKICTKKNIYVYIDSFVYTVLYIIGMNVLIRIRWIHEILNRVSYLVGHNSA